MPAAISASKGLRNPIPTVNIIAKIRMPLFIFVPSVLRNNVLIH
jgi:hypothetical protein